jgi:tRNA-2-methylthio-N6-dimethylallyladenosine synthase
MWWCREGLVVGVLGCMAERLKEKLLDSDKLADIVAGPDAYRDLPRLLSVVQVRGLWGALCLF